MRAPCGTPLHAKDNCFHVAVTGTCVHVAVGHSSKLFSCHTPLGRKTQRKFKIQLTTSSGQQEISKRKSASRNQQTEISNHPPLPSRLPAFGGCRRQGGNCLDNSSHT